LPALKKSSNQTKALFELKEHEITYLAIISANGDIPIALYQDLKSNQVFDFNDKQRNRLVATIYPALLAKSDFKIFEVFNNNSVMTSAVPIFESKPLDNDVNITPPPLGWLVISWSLYGDNLKKLSKILQVEITENKILNNGAIQKKQYLDLYAAVENKASPYQTRCFNSFMQQYSGCMKIHHQIELIPEIFSVKTLIIIFIFSLIPFISFTMILRFLILPIEKTTLYLHNAIEKDTVSKMNQKIDIIELDQARLAFNDLVDKIHEQQEKLETLSTTDALTQIPNRRALDLELEKTWNRINRHGGKVALILIDIDHFKLYNDFYGHTQGDEALIKVAQALQLFSRRSDEIAARYGGEEFILLFQYNEREEIDHLLQIINKTMEALSEPHEKSEFSYLTLSCGACWIECEINELNNSSLTLWIETADKALYQAKESGRNQHSIIPFQQI
jgi:diguanylate cyclase (GGDEF)-like protein